MQIYSLETIFSVTNSAATASDSGWLEVSKHQEKSIQVDLSSTGTVKVYGSNAENQPLSSNDGQQLGADIIIGKIQDITPATVRWLKVKITANGGVISYFVVGARKRR